MIRARDQGDLAVEDEGEAWQAAGARDRIDRAARGLQQWRLVDAVTDRLAPGALGLRQFGLRAEVAEVALVDLEGFGEGDR